MLSIDQHEDPHWSPYYSLCSPCAVDYDWIIKLEDHNLKDLEDSLLQTSGMARYGRLEIKNISKQPTRQTRDIYKYIILLKVNTTMIIILSILGPSAVTSSRESLNITTWTLSCFNILTPSILKVLAFSAKFSIIA